MKLSKSTVDVLKNFAHINKQILFRPGNVIRTQSPSAEDILASARVEETFPLQAGIHDLPRFIGALSLFDSPEITFGEHQLTISENKRTMHYTYAAESMIKSVPVDADLDLEKLVTFDVNASDLTSILKGIALLGCTQLAFIGDGENIMMRGVNLDDPTSDSFDVLVGTTDKNFKLYVFKDNLKMVPKDYTVSLCEDCVELASDTVTYQLAYHTSSDVGDLY